MHKRCLIHGGNAITCSVKFYGPESQRQRAELFDLSGVTTQAIKGVTVDQFGRIYLVAEDSGQPNSMLFVLSPVPEPETYAMLLAGLGLVGFVGRRRKTA